MTNSTPHFLLGLAATAAASFAQPAATPATPAPGPDWREQESPFLANHVQLTTRDQFVRAGEAYFSPEGTHIIFQAVPTPKEGEEADPFYAMYVARLKFEEGRVVGLDNIVRVSPPGSANTCGWFHPHDMQSVIFGSTVTRPADDQKSGFQVGTRRYVWMFPQEMEVVQARPFIVVGGAGNSNYSRGGPSPGSEIRSEVVFSLPNYDAECSFDSRGRFILYTHVEDGPEGGKPDGNIYVYDTKTAKHYPIVKAPGYDGGPFFSANDGFICYRSDRKGNDLLQLFVADLKHEEDEEGVNIPVGIEHEWQLTDNEHVNWCPYWHPSGEFIVYATSEVGHHNYEVFAIETPVWMLKRGTATPADLRRKRITFAGGADVLPAFSNDGRFMMWTSQRGPMVQGEQRPSSQLWIAEWTAGNPFRKPAPAPAEPAKTTP